MGKSIWLQADSVEIEELRAALADREGEAAVSLLQKIDLLMTSPETDELFRQAACEKYAEKLSDGEVDFQFDGLVSNGEEGAYVMAFLYVRNEEAGIEPEEDLPCEDEPLIA